jgi:flagellar export protein FliJ
MKKFAWRLERVLEIKVKQEEMQRALVAQINERIAKVKREIAEWKEKAEKMLAGVRQCGPGERIGQQAFVLKTMAYLNEQVEKTKKKLAELESTREREMMKLLEMRRFRMSLENLREAAKVQHGLEVKKFEQAQSDDAVAVATARDLRLEI